MKPGIWEVKLFAFLPPEHPLRPDIERFELELRRHGASELFWGAGPRSLHTGIGAGVAPDGCWRVADLYWSLQRRTAEGFDAGTLHYTSKTGRHTWLDYPADPRLPGLAEFLAEGVDARVLRYIPLRRVTLRVREPSGRAVVAKIKRASRFRQAWELLRLAQQRVAEAKPGFRVPRALGVQESRCLYFQEALPGRTLADFLDEAGAPEFLARLGALHRRLHALRPDGLPQRTNSSGTAQAESAAEWIGLMLPSHREAAARLAAALRSAQPAETTPAFCHGDPDCGQVLVEGDAWSLLDFDACHAGDPWRDVGMLAASLDYHVPRLRAAAEKSGAGAQAVDRAARAYIEAYFEGEPPDPARLAWHRACAEFHYLALVLKKDRYHVGAFTRRWGRLQERVAELCAAAPGRVS
jgi:aminoglycoside phosphotransferase (APT) family kinase protein